jgi:hypothetical protein
MSRQSEDRTAVATNARRATRAHFGIFRLFSSRVLGDVHLLT